MTYKELYQFLLDNNKECNGLSCPMVNHFLNMVKNKSYKLMPYTKPNNSVSLIRKPYVINNTDDQNGTLCLVRTAKPNNKFIIDISSLKYTNHTNLPTNILNEKVFVQGNGVFYVTTSKAQISKEYIYKTYFNIDIYNGEYDYTEQMYQKYINYTNTIEARLNKGISCTNITRFKRTIRYPISYNNQIVVGLAVEAPKLYGSTRAAYIPLYKNG